MKKIALYLSALLVVMSIVSATAQQSEKAIPLNMGNVQPLFVVDGKIYKHENVKTIDPTDIKEINVYKGEQAIKLFGKEAENGVVEIFTKDPAKTLEKLQAEIKSKDDVLFVIDGIPYPSSRVKDIDPNDIKKITVHKGAKAKALYGDRAVNGVVIIKTKAPNKIKKQLEGANKKE